MRTTKKSPLDAAGKKRLEAFIQSRFQELAEVLGVPSIGSHFRFFDREGPTWNQRQKLRQTLVSKLPPSPALAELLQPGRPPQMAGMSISLSHCPLMGGFIFSTGADTSLGLDIEQSDRVRWPAVARVSREEEVREAPHPSLLWCAKEAAVKSLPPGTLMGHITVSHWHPWKEGYRFSFHHGDGIAFLVENLAVGCTRLRQTGE